MNYHVSYLKCIFELGLNTQLSFRMDCNVAGNYISAQPAKSVQADLSIPLRSSRDDGFFFKVCQ